jgi:hypothetical protein
MEAIALHLDWKLNEFIKNKLKDAANKIQSI